MPNLWTSSRVLVIAGALLMGSGASVLAANAPKAKAPEVDLQLVMATDVSRSIDEEEAILQRQGVADAFSNPDIIRAIQAGSLGRIAVAYFDWSVPSLNKVIVDWMIIHDQASAKAFSQALMNTPLEIGQRTSISGAITSAMSLLDSAKFDATRRVIDISGDGPNNYGESLAPVREDAIARGVTINGIPIIVPDAQYAGRGFTPDIDKYYARCVIGGRGAFLIVARGFKDFATAIRHKLVLEISDLVPPAAPASAVIKAAATPRLAQEVAPNPLRPILPNQPQIVRPPAQRDTDCDRWGGFGGYGGYGRFP